MTTQEEIDGLVRIIARIGNELASLKDEKEAWLKTRANLNQRLDNALADVEALKRRVRELEEKRGHDCAALGCDRFDDDAFTEGLHEAGKRFWNKES